MTVSISTGSIGVIIPFYGAKHKLFRTLESVAKQTLAPDIIVLIDDCGPDPLTKEDELHWQERIPQLVYLNNEHNVGAGFTRNVGMDYLEGKVRYLHFLDSDDCVSDNFYNSLISVLSKNKECVAAFSKTIYQNQRGDINPEVKETSLYDGLFRYRPWATSSILWSSKATKGIKWLDLKSCEDTFFEIMVARNSDLIIGDAKSELYVFQEYSELINIERNKANDREIYRNRVKLYTFALTNIPVEEWYSGIENNLNVFTRRNIDLKFDVLFWESILRITFKLQRLNLIFGILKRYVYLKIALIYDQRFRIKLI